METSGNQIILSFANVNGGWRPFDTNELKGFTIAEDQKVCERNSNPDEGR